MNYYCLLCRDATAPTQSPARILVFGAPGHGKSSLVNLLIGSAKAEVSDFESKENVATLSEYRNVRMGDNVYTIVDTTSGIGRGTSSGGTEGETAQRVFKDFQNLFKELEMGGGFDLAIMVQRGRLTEACFVAMYKIFVQEKVLVPEKQRDSFERQGLLDSFGVPVILLVTGLENREDPDSWRTDGRNEYVLSPGQAYSKFGAVVCGTCATAPDPRLDALFRPAREATKSKVWAAITQFRRSPRTNLVASQALFIEMWRRFCELHKATAADPQARQHWANATPNPVVPLDEGLLKRYQQDVAQKLAGSGLDNSMVSWVQQLVPGKSRSHSLQHR